MRVFWGLASILEHSGHFRMSYKGGWVSEGSRSMIDDARGDVESVMGKDSSC